MGLNDQNRRTDTVQSLAKFLYGFLFIILVPAFLVFFFHNSPSPMVGRPLAAGRRGLQPGPD